MSNQCRLKKWQWAEIVAIAAQQTGDRPRYPREYIAALYGIHVARVSQLCAAAGLPPRVKYAVGRTLFVPTAPHKKVVPAKIMVRTTKRAFLYWLGPNHTLGGP